jgi:hypothetical protein
MNQITTTFLVGGSNVEVTAQCSGLSEAVYFAKCDAVCVQPKLLGSYVAGDKHLFVEAEMPNGTKVVASTGEEAFLLGGKAMIELVKAMEVGQRIFARVDTPLCQSASCKVIVSEKVESGCDVSSVFQSAGVLTGEMVCVGKDLYRMGWDGNGGKRPSVLVQEDCIYCGGTLPNTTGGGDTGGGDTGGGDTGGGTGGGTGTPVFSTVRLENTLIAESNAHFENYVDMQVGGDNSKTAGYKNGEFVVWSKEHSALQMLTELTIRYRAYGNTVPGSLDVFVNGVKKTTATLATEEVWRTLSIATDVQAPIHVIKLAVASYFSIEFDYIELKLQSVV